MIDPKAGAVALLKMGDKFWTMPGASRSTVALAAGLNNMSIIGRSTENRSSRSVQSSTFAEAAEGMETTKASDVNTLANAAMSREGEGISELVMLTSR
jgi:hypothetical protein